MKYFVQVPPTHTSPKDLCCRTGPLISRQPIPGVLFVDKFTSSYPRMVARCAKCAMATSLTTLVPPLATMATLEGHLASPKVCPGTFLGLVHRLGARPGLAPLSKMPTSLYTAVLLHLHPMSQVNLQLNKWQAILISKLGTYKGQSVRLAIPR